jgi:Gas vesicle synthesis protein GvpL/GvpF
MAASASGSIWYVYGIVASEMPRAPLPTGLDDAPVILEPCEGVAALVSVLDEKQYAPAALEINSGDVEWLSPRAVAHDRVLTWASDHGPVLPLPMFSLFSGRDAVCTMLRDREPQLSASLSRVARGREYALRVYRIDAELLGAVTSLSPRLEELAGVAAAASPGQRYLLERKLDGEKKTEVRAVSRRIVDEIVTELAPRAEQIVRSPIPAAADSDTTRGTMVLNAAFLVAPERLPAFQKTLTSIVARHDAHGFRFDFTGPWPPYHFVNEPTDGG